MGNDDLRAVAILIGLFVVFPGLLLFVIAKFLEVLVAVLIVVVVFGIIVGIYFYYHDEGGL